MKRQILILQYAAFFCYPTTEQVKTLAIPPEKSWSPMAEEKENV